MFSRYGDEIFGYPCLRIMRRIYTTEKISIDGVEVLGIDKLSVASHSWVIVTRRRLLRNVTLPEKVTAQMLSRFEDRPVRQAYFKIRGRSYFLDFFFPERMVAVEVDGSVHRLTKDHDRQRDADFRSIGIRTIRIKNKDVMGGRLYEKLYNALYKKIK